MIKKLNNEEKNYLLEQAYIEAERRSLEDQLIKDEFRKEALIVLIDKDKVYDNSETLVFPFR